MAGRNDHDVHERLVIARVGWCDKYDGDPNDEPRNGGGFNKNNVGSEHRNFLAGANGRYYGYAQPTRGGKPDLKRVTGSEPLDIGTDEERVDDVCVAMIARSDDLGQVLVGWYRHATFYAVRKNRHRRYCLWTARIQDSFLLPIAARTLHVPRGSGATGESNLTYARDEHGILLADRQYINQIRKAILTYDAAADQSPLKNLDAIVRGQGFQYDALYRREIETRAMVVARRELNKHYDTVKDYSKTESFDFLCRNGNGRPRKVEVKGTTTAGTAVLVSSNEYELARAERVDLYVVSGIQLRFTGDHVTAHGGTLTIHVDWGKNGHSVKPRGYAVTLIG